MKGGKDLNLADKKNVKKILDEEGFSFKKSLGQNFITDDTVCPRMAAAAADKETGVLEIGPGAGVLTLALSAAAGRVVSIEIDERLRPVLTKTLENCKNTKVVFGDVLKTDLAALIAEEFADCKRVTVCANLPYYITSPVIMRLIESKLPIDSITVMVQKEAADRLCAEVGTRAAGAVTAAVRYYAAPEMLFAVPRIAFVPQPKVDSAVIKLDILKQPPVEVKNEEMFFRVIRACFAQRRKTLLNTLSNTMGFEKERVRTALAGLDIPDTVRGETLTLKQIADISNLFSE